MPAEPQPILPAGIYVVGIDVNGNEFWLEPPASLTQAILVFDGQQFYWADGSNQAQFNLGNLEVNEGPYTGIAGFAPGGRMLLAVTDGLTRYILTSQNGVVTWSDLGIIGLPDTGFGILVKPQFADPAYFNAQNSMMFFGDDNEPFFIQYSALDNGKQVIIKDGFPQLLLPTSGSVIAGISNTGLEGVVSNSVGVTQVNVQAPTFTVSDGATDITLANINVTVDITNPNGLLGLDVGGENNSTWYYVFIVSDGVLTSAMISTDPTGPDFTNAPTYTHWGLVSVFRNDAAGNIIEYTQKGRDFYTVPVVFGNDISSSTVMAAIVGSVSLTTIIPPNTKAVSGNVGGSDNETARRSVTLAATVSGVNRQVIGSRENAVLSDGFKWDVGSFYNLPIIDPNAPQIFWKSNINLSNRRRIEVNHYRI